jgi:hypothetical protein
MPDRLQARRAMLLKIESAYGVDPTPTGAADALYCYDLKVDPMENQEGARKPVRPFFGADTPAIGGTMAKIDFGLAIAGSGTAGTALPTAYAAALRAAGRSQTINASVDVIYGLVGSGFESAAGYYNDDGVQHKLLGIRGNLSREFNHEQIPMYKFSGAALYSAPTDGALPTLTFPATWQKPLVVNKVNTTFSLHGFTAVLQSLSYDDGIAFAWKDYVNAEEVRISDRPMIKGKVVVQAGALSQKDWFNIAKGGTTGALSLVHGTTAGNKWKVDAATVLPKNPKYEVVDGITFYGMDLEFFPSAAGNDEIVERIL